MESVKYSNRHESEMYVRLQAVNTRGMCPRGPETGFKFVAPRAYTCHCCPSLKGLKLKRRTYNKNKKKNKKKPNKCTVII